MKKLPDGTGWRDDTKMPWVKRPMACAIFDGLLSVLRRVGRRRLAERSHADADDLGLRVEDETKHDGLRTILVLGFTPVLGVTLPLGHLVGDHLGLRSDAGEQRPGPFDRDVYVMPAVARLPQPQQYCVRLHLRGRFSRRLVSQCGILDGAGHVSS